MGVRNFTSEEEIYIGFVRKTMGPELPGYSSAILARYFATGSPEKDPGSITAEDLKARRQVIEEYVREQTSEEFQANFRGHLSLLEDSAELLAELGF